MKNTLEKWYSLNKLTPQQYYQLVDLVDNNTAYTLAELNLLAQLPRTDTLPNPPDELTRFQRARDYWEYEESLSDWVNEPSPNIFFSKEVLITLTLFTLLIILIIKENV